MKEQKGITLIALIITIIVMLILVAVTINVALNGGIFTKAKDATLKTEIAQIQEQLLLAKAVKVAENNGEEPDNYGITLESLNIPDNLKTKYQNKLEITADGKLNYIEGAVTTEEIAYFQSAGIAKKTEGIPGQGEQADPGTSNTPAEEDRYNISFKDNDVLAALDWAELTGDSETCYSLVFEYESGDFGFIEINIERKANISYQLKFTDEYGDEYYFNMTSLQIVFFRKYQIRHLRAM